MSLKNLIIHSLEKEQHSREVNPIISEATIGLNDDAVINFCDNLIDSYKNDNKISNSKFKTESFFKEDYDAFYSEDLTFVESTTRMIQKMEYKLSSVTSAKGGKFAFILEERDGNSFFYVFLIRDVKGGQISYSQEQKKYILNSIEYADTNNLAMAVRVNKKVYSEEEQRNYLSFTYSGVKQHEVSGYFSDWVGADEMHKNSEYAADLKKAINQIGDILEGEFQGSVTEKLQGVLRYVESNNEDFLNLYSLSEYLYGEDNRNKLRTVLEDNNYAFTEKFQLIPSSRKQFRNISVKANNITLQFPRHLYDEEIVDVRGGIVSIKDETLANKILEDYSYHDNDDRE